MPYYYDLTNNRKSDMLYPMSEFGKHLSSEMRKAEITGYDLSRRSGVSQSAISELERGLVPDPRISTVQKLSRVLPGLVRRLFPKVKR